MSETKILDPTSDEARVAFERAIAAANAPTVTDNAPSAPKGRTDKDSAVYVMPSRIKSQLGNAPTGMVQIAVKAIRTPWEKGVVYLLRTTESNAAAFDVFRNATEDKPQKIRHCKTGAWLADWVALDDATVNGKFAVWDIAPKGPADK